MTKKKVRRTQKEMLNECVLNAIGRASVCWTEAPKSTFDSTKALKIAEELIVKISKINNYRR